MPELAVIIPTFNERANIEPMLAALTEALVGIDFEAIFVDDDSPDDTAGLVRSISQRDPRVRVVHRINRRGLASATVEGMMASSAPYVAVMDADLQHDERMLPAMLELIKARDLDIVIGSRNVEGGSMGEFASFRVRLSHVGRWLSRIACHVTLSDPMSGFFMVTRSYLNETVRSLSSRGFKILLDLVASSQRPIKFAEVGYTFRRRLRGQSKLDILVGLEYLELLCDKLMGDWFPVSYLLFVGVGALGLALHLVMVALLVRLAQLQFNSAQIVSSLVVIGFNYFLNNYLTFRSSRVRGVRLLSSLSVFYLACTVGLVMNVALSRMLRSDGLRWYFAAAAGLAVGSVWNYWISSLFVWRTNRRRARRHFTERRVAAANSG